LATCCSSNANHNRKTLCYPAFLQRKHLAASLLATWHLDRWLFAAVNRRKHKILAQAIRFAQRVELIGIGVTVAGSLKHTISKTH